MSLAKLIQGNRDFQKSFQEDRKLYRQLAEEGQNPKTLWIGCSDSRVIPEFIMKAAAGDLFTIRNIANIIPPESAGDHSTASVLEYAVLHLEVEHIIICGHTCCGGITALIEDVPLETGLKNWLEYARPARESVTSESEEEKIPSAVKANILLQAQHLLTFDFIKKKLDKNILQIHKWLYDIHFGAISYYEEKAESWIELGS